LNGCRIERLSLGNLPNESNESKVIIIKKLNLKMRYYDIIREIAIFCLKFCLKSFVNCAAFRPLGRPAWRPWETLNFWLFIGVFFGGARGKKSRRALKARDFFLGEKCL
jgi:hypothetical protein